ncbi:hypothetical protein V9J15_02975 [Candidatus Liberibacter africanus]|nr:hypothetical protein [Candidatus Liberibacter africanus]
MNKTNRRGLPVRGQRTHTNSRTRKKSGKGGVSRKEIVFVV